MDGILNLLPLYTEDPDGELNLGQLLKTCRTHQSFSCVGDQQKRQEEQDHALGIINSKLNNADSRIEGALLLDALIPQCRTEIFTSHCISWIHQVMRLLQGTSKVEGGATACIVLGKLLMYSSQFPEVSRQVGSSVISPLVTSLCDTELMHKSHISDHIFKCIQSCMRHYHSACGPLKNMIERHLLSMVDWRDMSLDSDLQSAWAECLALLPGLGGSGTNGIQHKTNWIELCTKIISSIHSSLNGLFRNVQEIKTYEVTPANSLKLPELHHSNPMALLQLERRRLSNLCSALASLFCEPFSAPKTVPMDLVLEMISRLLALNSKTLSKTGRANFEQLTLGSIIPDLHAAAVQVLTALVAVCKGQLVTRASSVMNLHVQVLQWTFTPLNQRHPATERPYGQLRGQVYQSLCSWLVASRSACGLTKCADVLLSQLLSDIVVQRETVQLLTVNTGGSAGGQSSGKKGKKKLLDQQTAGVIQHKADERANADVCHSALQCLATLLLYCGPRIKPAIHKEMQEIVISVLMDLTSGGQMKALQPYNDPRCRAGLFRVLERLILCPSPHWPAPLNYATAVFNSGLNDANLEVSMVCAEGLVSIQSILRPRGPTLNIALDVAARMRPAQQVGTLLSANVAATSAETVPVAIVSAAAAAETPPPEATIEIRQPEESPGRTSVTHPIVPVAVAAEAEVYSTPPSGVTTLATIVATSPTDSPALMTRTEALKLIAVANHSSAEPPLQIKSSPVHSPLDRNSRKRALTNSETPDPPQEKILKELPYGADAVDDDVESMLASFHDVPPE